MQILSSLLGRRVVAFISFEKAANSNCLLADLHAIHACVENSQAVHRCTTDP